MNSIIQKWGNSLALRIPKNLADDSGFSEGNAVELIAEKNKIIIRRKRRKKFLLKELLNDINKNNLHSEIDFGKPTGKELI